jgi:hypothetical protein
LIFWVSDVRVIRSRGPEPLVIRQPFSLGNFFYHVLFCFRIQDNDKPLLNIGVSIPDATFEGAKSTILYHWAQAKKSENQNLYHHFQTAKAIYYAKETFCKSDDQNASFSNFIFENCGLSSR